MINFSSGKETNGSLFDVLSGTDNSLNPMKNKLAAEASKKRNLATAPLVSFNTTIGTDGASNEDEYYAASDFMDMYQPEPTIDNQIVLASIGPEVRVAKEKRGARTYEVKMGDTASSIAAANGVSTSTILYANNLSDTSLLKPGDKLTILPITGASYKIQKNDSLVAIAKKYNADPEKIIAYNDLPADGQLRDGQILLIPDGYIAPTPTAPSQSGTQLAIPGSSSGYASSAIRLSGGGTGHRFPYGYCTWYVAQRRYIPWAGNAISWLSNARAYGKATGRTPQPGAIMVSTESRWGHVALVESVSGSSFTISEMNYRGFARKSTRTLSVNSGVIRGFIY